jgi:hypothetical protein
MPTLHPYVRSKQKAQYARVCYCGKSFVTNISYKVCCSRSCSDKKWRKEHPRPITASQVRAEEGRTKQTVTVSRHASYPPFGACACLACREERARSRLQAAAKQIATITAAIGD